MILPLHRPVPPALQKQDYAEEGDALLLNTKPEAVIIATNKIYKRPQLNIIALMKRLLYTLTNMLFKKLLTTKLLGRKEDNISTVLALLLFVCLCGCILGPGNDTTTISGSISREY